VDGEVENAAIFNPHLRDNLLWIGSGLWTAYTTTWSGTLGNGVKVAAYARNGNTIHYRIAITWGTTTSHAAARQTFTVPVVPNSAYGPFHVVGTANCNDNGVNSWDGAVHFNGTTSTVEVIAGVSLTATVAGAVTNLVPHTWGSNDQISIIGTYEAL
jgi:hypothetical protein